MSGGNISLHENGELVTNQNDVVDIFNEYFVNITKNLSEAHNLKEMDTADLVDHYVSHPSITCIQNFMDQESVVPFSFTPVTNTQVMNKLKGLKSKKAVAFQPSS